MESLGDSYTSQIFDNIGPKSGNGSYMTRHNRRECSSLSPIPKKEQGRNEKCNCGSNLKYKKCCGK